MSEVTQTPPDTAASDMTILDLDQFTSPRRPTVKFENVEYELHLMSDFGIADQHFLQNAGNEFSSLWQKKNLTAAEVRRMKHLMNKMSSMVLDAPQKVLDKMNDFLKNQVILVFSVAPLVMQENETEPEEESPQTSES